MAENVEAKVSIFEPSEGNFIVKTSDSGLAVRLVPLLATASTITIITPTDIKVVNVAKPTTPVVPAVAPEAPAPAETVSRIEADDDVPPQPPAEEASFPSYNDDPGLPADAPRRKARGRAERPVAPEGVGACRRCGGTGDSCPVCAGTGRSRVPAIRPRP